MTDEIAALSSLDFDCPSRAIAMQEFYLKWQDAPLVLLKWFALQAMSNVADNVSTVKRLAQHPSFKITNPTCCYSLFGSFARCVIILLVPILLWY